MDAAIAIAGNTRPQAERGGVRATPAFQDLLRVMEDLLLEAKQGFCFSSDGGGASRGGGGRESEGN